MCAIGVGQPPKRVNVVIEISANSYPVKYECDKVSGMLCVDRFLCTSMVYPCNYGFIPHTLGGDGDPLDALVYSTYPIIPNAFVVARPVGMLMTEDENGEDAKLVLVPSVKVDPFLEHVQNQSDLPLMFRRRVEHFFERYKDLEDGKWVKVHGWADSVKAEEKILDGVRRYSGLHNQ